MLSLLSIDVLTITLAYLDGIQGAAVAIVLLKSMLLILTGIIQSIMAQVFFGHSALNLFHENISSFVL